MESTFTKHPEPVSDTETSWKDNQDWQSEYTKKYEDPKLALPARSVQARFARVPDFNDPEFEWDNAEAHLKASEQRHRERFVAIAEMKILQDQLRTCQAKNTVNAPRLCRPLAYEYMRRLRCPFYVCDSKERPVLMTAQYGSANSKVVPRYGGFTQTIDP